MCFNFLIVTDCKKEKKNRFWFYVDRIKGDNNCHKLKISKNKYSVAVGMQLEAQRVNAEYLSCSGIYKFLNI